MRLFQPFIYGPIWLCLSLSLGCAPGELQSTSGVNDIERGPADAPPGPMTPPDEERPTAEEPSRDDGLSDDTPDPVVHVEPDPPATNDGPPPDALPGDNDIEPMVIDETEEAPLVESCHFGYPVVSAAMQMRAGLNSIAADAQPSGQTSRIDYLEPLPPYTWEAFPDIRQARRPAYDVRGLTMPGYQDEMPRFERAGPGPNRVDVMRPPMALRCCPNQKHLTFGFASYERLYGSTWTRHLGGERSSASEVHIRVRLDGMGTRPTGSMTPWCYSGSMRTVTSTYESFRSIRTPAHTTSATIQARRSCPTATTHILMLGIEATTPCVWDYRAIRSAMTVTRTVTGTVTETDGSTAATRIMTGWALVIIFIWARWKAASQNSGSTAGQRAARSFRDRELE